MTVVVCMAAVDDVVAAPTECASSEQRIFGCKTARKSIAVCGVDDVADASRRYEYRFGTPSHAELVVAARVEDSPPHAISRGELMFSPGGGAYLRFQNGDTDYVVYSAISSKWGEAEGVVVQRGGRSLPGAKCVGRVTSTIDSDAMRSAGIRLEPPSFTLPP